MGASRMDGAQLTIEHSEEHSEYEDIGHPFPQIRIYCRYKLEMPKWEIFGQSLARDQIF